MDDSGTELHAEYHRLYAAVKTDPSKENYEALEAFVIKNRYGDNAQLDDETSAPGAGNNDVLAAAIGMAQEQGDTATVAKLKALAEKPDELAALIVHLQGAPAQ